MNTKRSPTEMERVVVEIGRYLRVLDRDLQRYMAVRGRNAITDSSFEFQVRLIHELAARVPENGPPAVDQEFDNRLIAALESLRDVQVE